MGQSAYISIGDSLLQEKLQSGQISRVFILIGATPTWGLPLTEVRGCQRRARLRVGDCGAVRCNRR